MSRKIIAINYNKTHIDKKASLNIEKHKNIFPEFRWNLISWHHYIITLACLSRFLRFNCRVRVNTKQPNRNEWFSTQRFSLLLFFFSFFPPRFSIPPFLSFLPSFVSSFLLLFFLSVRSQSEILIIIFRDWRFGKWTSGSLIFYCLCKLD